MSYRAGVQPVDRLELSPRSAPPVATVRGWQCTTQTPVGRPREADRGALEEATEGSGVNDGTGTLQAMAHRQRANRTAAAGA